MHDLGEEILYNDEGSIEVVRGYMQSVDKITGDYNRDMEMGIIGYRKRDEDARM